VAADRGSPEAEAVAGPERPGPERQVSSIDDRALEAIVAAGRTERDEVIGAVRSATDVAFTWDYEHRRHSLVKLYEKAKHSQWNGSTDLPWDADVDQERVARQLEDGNARRFAALAGADGSPLRHWGEAEWTQFSIEAMNSMLSQFMHGEQGALVCTAQIVETVPWIDAKYYAATQVMDEARHVEVFWRYLDEKLSGHYPINPYLRSLLDTIIADERWDITYLGMQVMVEGLALAVFGAIHQTVSEPLLKRLLRYVMADEARHVAFGVLGLQEYYAQLSTAEVRERQEFAYETALFLRRRWFQPDVWERMGVDPRPVVRLLIEAPHAEERAFSSMLFSKIVPNCRKLGLLDAGDGWLRSRFTELGVIGFEDAADTGEEYSAFDEVAKDRAATSA
jgi:hypothetical protein